MYKECNFKSTDLNLNSFITLCDKKKWSLKIAGHYNDVKWNIKKENEYMFGNPTHHIQTQEQLLKFMEYLNISI
jgi:hypothetical protein